MSQFKFAFGTAIILGFLCSGCVTSVTGYRPPSMSQSEMAHVKEIKIMASGEERHDARTRIVRIDGVKTMGIVKLTLYKTYDIAPGKRTLDVVFTRNLGSAYRRISFIAEAGKTYRVTGNVEKKEGALWKRVHLYVEDDKTGENVSDSFSKRPQ